MCKETQNPELEGSTTSKPGKIWNFSLPSLLPCFPQTFRPKWGLLASPGLERASTVSCPQSLPFNPVSRQQREGSF